MSTQTSLQALILTGALHKLSEFFQQVIPTANNNQPTDYKQLIAAFNTSNDNMAIYDMLRRQVSENKQMSLPFLSLTLDTLMVSAESTKNVGAHYRMGHNIAVTEDQGLFLHTATIPTIFECTIKFLSDDFWQMLNFCSRWIVGTQDKSILNYNATWNNINFTTKVELAPSVVFPQKDNTLDITNLYEFNGTLKIHGTIGSHDTVNKMQKVSALKQINVQTIVLPEGHELPNPEILKNLILENFTI